MMLGMRYEVAGAGTGWVAHLANGWLAGKVANMMAVWGWRWGSGCGCSRVLEMLCFGVGYGGSLLSSSRLISPSLSHPLHSPTQPTTSHSPSTSTSPSQSFPLHLGDQLCAFTWLIQSSGRMDRGEKGPVSWTKRNDDGWQRGRKGFGESGISGVVSGIFQVSLSRKRVPGV
jgi:hypothetical protein